VDVVDPAQLPLGRLLPPAAARAMHDALAEQGISWHFGTTVQTLQHAGNGIRATLSDGSTITTDVVLSAIGLRPRTALAAASGIRVNRGIIADKTLRTSAADVYTLGDCAEVSGMVLPFVMPLMHAARALARTLNGEPAEVSYPAMPVVVKTPALPTVISPPAMGAEGRWAESGDARNVRALFEAPDGTPLGFVLTGSATAEKMALTKLMPAVLD
jgi:rubredoxin-NAD+ reductase